MKTYTGTKDPLQMSKQPSRFLYTSRHNHMTSMLVKIYNTGTTVSGQGPSSRTKQASVFSTKACEGKRFISSVQFRPLINWVLGGWGRDIIDDSAEILFQSSLREAIVSSSGMDRDVLSLTLSIQHFLCRPRRRPPSKVPWRMTMERLSWRVTYPNHTNVRLLTGNVKRRKWLYSTYYSSHRVSTGHSVTGKQTRTIPLLFWLHVSECEVAEKRKTYFPVAALLRGKRNAQIPDRHAPHFAHAQKRECVRSQTCLSFLRVRPVGNGSSLNEKSDNHTDDSRGM